MQDGAISRRSRIRPTTFKKDSQIILLARYDGDTMQVNYRQDERKSETIGDAFKPAAYSTMFSRLSDQPQQIQLDDRADNTQSLC
jgi:hypothetical protein